MWAKKEIANRSTVIGEPIAQHLRNPSPETSENPPGITPPNTSENPPTNTTEDAVIDATIDASLKKLLTAS